MWWDRKWPKFPRKKKDKKGKGTSCWPKRKFGSDRQLGKKQTFEGRGEGGLAERKRNRRGESPWDIRLGNGASLSFWLADRRGEAPHILTIVGKEIGMESQEGDRGGKEEEKVLVNRKRILRRKSLLL